MRTRVYMKRMAVLLREDRLAFAVAALDLEALLPARFAEACVAAAAAPWRSFADVAIEAGYMTRKDCARVDAVLAARAEPTPQTLDTLRLPPARPPADPAAQPTVDHVDMYGELVLRGLHSVGGSGEVWRAHDPVFGRDVALKRLRPEHGADPGHLMRFLREARLTAQLEHPGVVPVYAHGGVGAGAYYTMRLLRGRTLREHIAAFHQSVAREGSGESFVGGGLLHLLGYFIRLCETIAFAHAQGVLHRDLKGSNVMIGDFGEVTVLAWGLAKEIDRPEPSPGNAPAPDAFPGPGRRPAHHTLDGTQLGTPGFMSPEQARGELARIDCRTDVYGLAAVLYEILTGQPPFTGGTPLELVARAASEVPPTPRTINPAVPVALEEVCLRGLQRDPEARPARASELGEAVERWLGAVVESSRAVELELQAILDSAPDAMCVIDAAGVIVRGNQRLREMFGYSAGELEGQTLDQLLPAAARAGHGEHIKAYVKAPRSRRMGVVGGLQGIRRDGTALAIDVSLSPAHTPLGLRVVCAIRDRADWR